MILTKPLAGAEGSVRPVDENSVNPEWNAEDVDLPFTIYHSPAQGAASCIARRNALGTWEPASFQSL